MPIVRLSDSVSAAVNNISRIFDRDLDGIPYFGVALLAGRPHFYHIPFFDISHMPGRALDALLLAESVFDLTIEEGVINRYRDALLHSFAGGDSLNGYYDTGLGQKRVAFHNLREGLQGLNALIKFRDDTQARNCADEMVSRLSSLVTHEGFWDPQRIREHKEYLPLGDVVRHDKYPTSTAGRLIGSLVKYYRTTHNEQSLDLAKRFQKAVINKCFDEEGHANQHAGWHVHSITSSISSLAELADILDDSDLKEKVAILYAATFDGVIMTRFGWSKENLENRLDVGEINNTGDIIQTALLLAKWKSFEFFEDVERMLRSHVIPSQLIGTDWIDQVKDPVGDYETDIPDRVHGAFGFPAPYGHQALDTDFLNFNFDITCGAVQALCIVATRAVEVDDTVRINLLIDHTSPEVRVRSMFPQRGLLTVELLVNRPCEVRIPDWVDRRTLLVRRNEISLTPSINNGYLVLKGEPGTFDIEFIANSDSSEELVNGRMFHFYWKGNQVVGMEPVGDFLSFFPHHPSIGSVSQVLHR
jgi:hypothetical protein